MAKTNEYDARVEPEPELSATGATIAIPSEAGAVETATASMASSLRSTRSVIFFR